MFLINIKVIVVISNSIFPSLSTGWFQSVPVRSSCFQFLFRIDCLMMINNQWEDLTNENRLIAHALPYGYFDLFTFDSTAPKKFTISRLFDSFIDNFISPSTADFFLSRWFLTGYFSSTLKIMSHFKDRLVSKFQNSKEDPVLFKLVTSFKRPFTFRGKKLKDT